MDIKHPRRILALGAPGSPVLDILKDLTGTSPPTSSSGSAAGSIHEWEVKTAYYTAKVPIWIDEVTDTEVWREEFMKEEAREVVEAVGAFVYCFRISDGDEIGREVEEVMEAIQAIVEEHAGYGADHVMLAVGVPVKATVEGQVNQDEWDDACTAHGFEFINYAAKGKNEYGERVGFERLKEALEACEWDAGAEGDDEELDLDELDFDAVSGFGMGFGREEAEISAELFGMKAALSGAQDFDPEVEEAEEVEVPEKQASQVEDLDRMMGKLLAVKEQSAELPEAQRKRAAAKAVRELMNEG